MVSEELKTRYFAERLYSEAAMLECDKCDFDLNKAEAILEKFAAQVCEQREKEDAVADAEIQEIVGKYQRDAEAAELALQDVKKELAENEAMDDGNFRAFKLLEARNAELLLALQAKEQELGKICEAHNYGVNILTELAAAKLELAELRKK